MTWTALATLSLAQDWKFTPAIAGNLGYLRLQFETAGIPIEIGQIDPATGDIYDRRKILATSYDQIFEFKSPVVWESRALALRLLIPSTSFNVAIELSSIPIPSGGSSAASVDLQPVLSGQSEISANIQSIASIQNNQSTELNQLITGQTQILQAVAGINIQPSLQYYKILALLGFDIIAPLEDNDSSVRNYQGEIIGGYTGSYQQLMPSLFSDSSRRSTRFNGAGVDLQQFFINPFPYTYVVRANIDPDFNDFAGLFHFGSSRNFDASPYDRQLYVEPGGSLGFYNYNGNVQTISTPASYKDGVTHTFAARADQNGYAVFVDGQKVVSSNAVGSYQNNGFFKLGWIFNGILGAPSPAQKMRLAGAGIAAKSISDAQMRLIHELI